MFAALFGRLFWLPAYSALLLGLFLPGDYSGLRPLIPLGVGGILFFTCLKVRLDSVGRELRGGRAWGRLCLLCLLKLLVYPLLLWLPMLWLLPAWSPGLLLVAAMPAGLASAAFTDLHRGNTSLALLMILSTSLLCPLLVPPLIAWARSMADLPEAGMDPSRLAQQAGYILVILLVPFLLAQGLRRAAPAFVARHHLWWGPAAVASLCLMIFLSVASNRVSWSTSSWGMIGVGLLAVCAMSAAFLMIGWLHRASLGRSEAVAITCNCVYMNNGLGMAFASAFFADEAQMILPSVLMQVPMVIGVANVGKVVGKLRTSRGE